MADRPEFRRIVDYTELEALLECPLCLDRFDQPRFLPCGHTYCTKCLNELSAGSDSITCPQCRQSYEVPVAGVASFPRNISCQKLIDIRIERLVSTRQCQVCDRKHAFSDCLHCHKSVCYDCKEKHRQELVTKANVLLLDVEKSSDLCKTILNKEIVTVLERSDRMQKQISTHTKELIECLKQEEERLMEELKMVTVQQIEWSTKILQRFNKTKEEIDNFILLSRQNIEMDGPIHDEKYIEIETMGTKYSAVLQNFVTLSKQERKDFKFVQLIQQIGHIGEIKLPTNLSNQPISLPITIDDNTNQPQLTSASTTRQIGGWGSGPLEFWCPSGLAITSTNDRIIIVDSWNHRLQMITTDGEFVCSTSGVKGRRIDELNNPRDVCINKANEWFIVSDSGNHRLVVYNINNFQVQRLIGGNDSKAINFHFPFGICCDENDAIYVCDRGNNRIVVLNFDDGILLRQWGKKGIAHGEFDAPDFICYRKNIVAVSDFNNHRIQVFTMNGQFLFQFGRLGSGQTGEFRYPRGIAIDDEGYFMVADWINNRLQLFTPSGEISAIVDNKVHKNPNDDDGASATVVFDRPIGVTVSNEGVIFVTEWGRSHRVVIY